MKWRETRLGDESLAPVAGVAFPAQDPSGPVRQVERPQDARPGEVVFRHKPSGELYAAVPGTRELSALRHQGSVLDWEQLHLGVGS